MKREIKFRAWEQFEPDHAEDMGEVGQMHFTEDYGADDELYDKRTVVVSGFYHDSGWDWSDFEIMQYTGLKDKNGKEIYEGDIVSSASHEPKEYEVRFVEAGFCCDRDDLFIPMDLNHFFPSNGTDIEVIGNIYKNPDLLNDQSTNSASA